MVSESSWARSKGCLRHSREWRRRHFQDWPGEGHARNDLRSIWLHEAVAEHLRREPERTLSIAARNLQRRQGRIMPAWEDAWRKLLDKPTPQLARALVDTGEAMTALRQTSPFAGVLSNAERELIYRTFSQWWDRESRES